MTKLLSRYALSLWITAIVTLASDSPAQTFTTLTTLNGTDEGNAPRMSLIQGFNGRLYGTASGLQSAPGGDASAGTVLSMSPSGALTTLYTFCAEIGCPDGAIPVAGLVQHTNASLYGTTYMGGTNCTGNAGCGTIFSVSPQGVVKVLYSFCDMTNCADGAWPYAALVEGTDGNLYGTTWRGGASECTGSPSGCGTIFKITTEGALKTLYTFCSKGFPQCPDGAAPQAQLILATDGNFYGTTSAGGTNESGTIFKITPKGKLTTLYSFCSKANCSDGAEPSGALLEATSGDFYGTTASGGFDTCNPPDGCGTIFKMNMGGLLTVVHAFNGDDGSFPLAGVVQGSDGNFYGTTWGGGIIGCEFPVGCGTIFSMTKSGNISKLYSFCSAPNCADGALPYGGLTQDTNGVFYGTTYEGGNQLCLHNQGCGTLFSLSVGLGPFVESVPSAGRVGTEVGIFGTDLSGSTSVTFDGTPAKFSVQSPSLILTRVPTDATTGKITVTMLGQKLSTIVPFFVIP